MHTLSLNGFNNFSTGAHVRVGYHIFERFSTSSGVRQGCVLAPALFAVLLIGFWSTFRGINIGKCNFTDIDYADDIALPASNVGDVSHSLGGFSSESRSIGLNVLCGQRLKFNALAKSNILS